jgi:hypothetical protein
MGGFYLFLGLPRGFLGALNLGYFDLFLGDFGGGFGGDGISSKILKNNWA